MFRRLFAYDEGGVNHSTRTTGRHNGVHPSLRYMGAFCGLASLFHKSSLTEVLLSRVPKGAKNALQRKLPYF